MSDDKEWKTGRDYLDAAFNSIDAAMFSGDAFLDRHCSDVLQRHIARWQRGLIEQAEMRGSLEDDDDK